MSKGNFSIILQGQYDSYASDTEVDPKNSFAWKDNTLERELKALKGHPQGGKHQRFHPHNQDYEDDLRDRRRRNNQALEKNIDESLARLNSSGGSGLPKAPDQEVVLLKKAREERKVRRYLDDRFTNRPDLVKPNEEIYQIKREYESEDEEGQRHKMADLAKIGYKGSGPRTKDGKYESDINTQHSLHLRLSQSTAQ